MGHSATTPTVSDLERGCHTALREIYHTWKGTAWIIEGDIADCFGSLDHDLIISALAEHIQDGQFLNLVKKLLDAGYMEDWKLNKTLSGVPQGSILSPVLSNILLNKLDRFVENELMPLHNKGSKRKLHQAYTRLINRARKLTKERAEGGCSKDQTAGAETFLNRPSRPRLPATQVL